MSGPAVGAAGKWAVLALDPLGGLPEGDWPGWMTCRTPAETLEQLDVAGAEVLVVLLAEPALGAFIRELDERSPESRRIVVTDTPSHAKPIDARTRYFSLPIDSALLTLATEAARAEYLRDADRRDFVAELTRRDDLLFDQSKRLEAMVEQRTVQLARAKCDWERSFDAIVDPLAIVDSAHRVLRANRAYAACAGVDVRAVPGQKCHRLIANRDTPCPGCPLSSTLRGELAPPADIIAVDGRTLSVWSFRQSGAEEGPSGICYYRDVSVTRVLEARLERTQRLASLGLFAGGLAHELNNPLGSILAYAQFHRREVNVDEELARSLGEIEQGALRCKRIIDSLLVFAHDEKGFRRAPIDVGVLVRGAVDAFRRDYRARGQEPRIDVFVGPDVPTLLGEEALLHQLLRNLLQNAERAVSAANGRVEVRVEYTVKDQVRLEVSDDGIGIREQLLARIFDPFYTTKAEWSDCGLGLPICSRIVESHGGQIDIRSREGEGTTVSIVLPAAPSGLSDDASGGRTSAHPDRG